MTIEQQILAVLKSSEMTSDNWIVYFDTLIGAL